MLITLQLQNSLVQTIQQWLNQLQWKISTATPTKKMLRQQLPQALFQVNPPHVLLVATTEENAEGANTQSLIASAVKRHQETTSSRPPVPPLPRQPPFNVIRPLSSSTASLPRTGAKACPPIKRTLSATSTRTDEEEIPQELEGGGQRLASYNRLSSSDDPSELAPVADVAINADNNDPLFEGGRVMEMVTNKSGVVTSVRRSQRNRDNE